MTKAISKYNEAEIATEMSILKSAFPKLNAPDQALRALVIAAKFSGLNPFRGEIYYIPGVGIAVASKIKAADAISYAARNNNTLDIAFDQVTKAVTEITDSKMSRWRGEVGDNDTVYACTITSHKQIMSYYQKRIAIIDELRALGYAGKELETELENRAGKIPETVCLGIVKASENFGGDTKYSRQERARKRALQAALNAGGYAAPDIRNYGGVAIGEDVVEGEYKVVENEPAHVPTEIDEDQKRRIAELKTQLSNLANTAKDKASDLSLSREVATMLTSAVDEARKAWNKNGHATIEDLQTAINSVEFALAQTE